jgi:hypothetical protein
MEFTMDSFTLHQLRGAADLIQETIDVSVTAIEETHQSMVRRHYFFLEQVQPIAGTVRIIALLQLTFTRAVYESIRGGNRIVGFAAKLALDLLEKQKALS